MTALLSLSRAMFKGFFRDRMTLFWAVLFPLMFLVLFGGILTDRGAPKLEVAQIGDVAALDRMPAETREALEQSVEITRSDDEAQALRDVRDGDLAAVVTEDGDRLVVHFSQADQVAAARVRATFQGIVDAANLARTGVEPAYALDPRQVEDESLETIQYVTPGLLGWAIAMSATFGAATNLVNWRKSGLLRRLRLTPIPTSSVVLARVGVSLLVALGQAVIFVALAVFAFGLQLTGWWPLVVPLVLAGTLAFLSIGLLAGAVSKTEEGAVGLANFVVLPMAFLSGSFFSLEGAPGWLQAVSRLLPLRHLNDAMLDVMVRGQGVAAIWQPMLILVAFAAVCALVAGRLFRWET
ncbi:transport permease protein [Aeromicrobium flavum]|uniref:Transport permease protein n=1 Tax=Aeromicrobium flavum TaxID=416568 RepID=A0A512HSL3_9ACTN|nr:ABC transporter permease [Aeromicrobium flavum]GEO88436.1 transport permease protein [Aeromicrobium flavum]